MIDTEYPDDIECSEHYEQQIAYAFRHILLKCGMIVESDIIDHTIHRSVNRREVEHLRETIKCLEEKNEKLRQDRTATTIGFAVMCILYIAAVLIFCFS